jgi:hypothetical protein
MKKNPQDATLRNVRAAHKRDQLLKDALINAIGTLDRRVTGTNDVLDGLIKRVAALEKARR